MHLSPLQSRLVASLVASCLLIALYWTLFTPHFAVALEVEVKTPILLDDVDFTANSGGPLDSSYEPEFSAFDRSIIGRAPEGVTALTNNEAMPMNVVAGTTQLFTFSVGSVPEGGTAGGSLELRSEQTASEQQSSGTEANEKTKLAGRQESRTVFISANTCEQPRPIAPSRTGEAPPQLTLYISTSSANQSPGPLADTDSQVIVDFIEGAAMYNLTLSDDVYIGVHAPNSTSFTGAYNFRIAASTDAYFYTYNGENNAGLIFVDSDSQGALLITHNLTDSSDPAVEQKLMGSMPYVMFAHNKNDPSINGLRFSYCGLQNRAQIAATKDGQFANMVSTAMTKRGPGNLPKQQFFFSGLNASSNYSAILAKDGTASGNGLVGGGGLVFRATDFNTKSDHGNCALVVDLAFCDQVDYAVPSNPNKKNITELARFYDSYAAAMYDNFNKSLAQIACEAPSNQRYSLARSCDDCAVAYKDWLCYVTIPRCEDFSNPASYLQPRAMSQPFPNGDTLDQAILLTEAANTWASNSSRNRRIDEEIQPGPYKEVLPCDHLCYNIVQSCPSALGFSCPLPGQVGFSASYGQRPQGGSTPTCNFPGSAHIPSITARVAATRGQILAGLIVVGFAHLLL